MSRKDADGPHLGARWAGGQVFGVVCKDMADLFLLRTCACCSGLFCLCRKHDRGHAYCSDSCRNSGRKRSVRRARSRYQRSAEGRDDQRDRMRFRRSMPRSRVMDQGSEKLAQSEIVLAPVHACGSSVESDDMTASETNDRIDHGSDSARNDEHPNPSAEAWPSTAASVVQTRQPLDVASPACATGEPGRLPSKPTLRCIVCGRVGDLYLVGGILSASTRKHRSVALGAGGGSHRAPPRR